MSKKLGEKYLSGQIITYMGNKRKLLDLIGEQIDKIKNELKTDTLTVGDGFAGSGVVSRLLKTKATKLYTNDIAGYSKTLNECYLSNPDTKMLQQIQLYIDEANHLASLSLENNNDPPFISGNWAPSTPDIQLEDRVYFTYENGKRIDIIRNYIETLPFEYRPYLLAPLLVECSIHNNTNGQFSAFYKDSTTNIGSYGGKGGVDIKRITKEIELPFPLLDDTLSPCETTITQMDTNLWARSLLDKELDIVYYDPPYNKHPYAIYYFMLEIINTWDKNIQIPNTNRGQPEERTKSSYNSYSKAQEALNDLLANTNAKYIILSYNDGGIIPIPELDTLLAKHCKELEKIPIDHKTYNRFKGISNYKRTNDYKPVKEYMYILKKV